MSSLIEVSLGTTNKSCTLDSHWRAVTEQGCCACLQTLQQQHAGEGGAAARKPPGRWGMTAEGRATHYPVPQPVSEANDEVCCVCWQGVTSYYPRISCQSHMSMESRFTGTRECMPRVLQHSAHAHNPA